MTRKVRSAGYTISLFATAEGRTPFRVRPPAFSGAGL
ncbi:hypothetical protein J3R03_005484 [Actinoplanes couchii]|nr:hypothetical protein [Actinoplanes couchii]